MYINLYTQLIRCQLCSCVKQQGLWHHGVVHLGFDHVRYWHNLVGSNIRFTSPFAPKWFECMPVNLDHATAAKVFSQRPIKKRSDSHSDTNKISPAYSNNKIPTQWTIANICYQLFTYLTCLTVGWLTIWDMTLSFWSCLPQYWTDTIIHYITSITIRNNIILSKFSTITLIFVADMVSWPLQCRFRWGRQN